MEAWALDERSGDRGPLAPRACPRPPVAHRSVVNLPYGKPVPMRNVFRNASWRVAVAYDGVHNVLARSCADESRPLPTAEQRPRAVRVAEARILTLLTGVDYVGTLRSAREVEVVARTAGTIVALPVDEGFRVTTGEIVAQLDDAEIRSLRRQVRSDRRRVRTDRDYVCDSAATDERLARQGAISTAQVDRSRATCQSAEAVVETVQARLDEVESVLERTDELSPFDGIVLRRVAEVGQNVVPGRPLMILGDTNLEVVVPVGSPGGRLYRDILREELQKHGSR